MSQSVELCDSEGVASQQKSELIVRRISTALRATFVAFIGVCALVGEASAIDPPHYSGNSVQCLSCHQPHMSAGNNLTRASTNALVCQMCHSTGGIAEFFPMQDADRSVPKVSGNSHQWGVNANNSTYGASVPPNTYSQNSDADMYIRLDTSDPANPKIICSACHNQHNNASKWGRIHLSSVTRVWGSGHHHVCRLRPRGQGAGLSH